MEWLLTEYSQRLFEKIGMKMGPGVAGIAEDAGDIVVWFWSGEEVRFSSVQTTTWVAAR